MKQLFLALMTLFSATAAFAGGDTITHDAIVRTEKLLSRVNALLKKEVAIRKHIPSLATFATAQLPDNNDPRISMADWQYRMALRDQNVPLPQEKDAFWYAYLTSDKRLADLTPYTTSPVIRKTIEAHGQLIAHERTVKKEQKKDALSKKITQLNQALSAIDSVMNCRKKS